MEEFDFNNNSHQRYNPLIREWVLCSPQRMKRPWQGKLEDSESTEKNKGSLQYDPNCYLCPGNKRANGKVNENYQSTYVFENDFSAISSNNSRNEGMDFGENIGTLTVQSDFTESLFRVEPVTGECKVIVYSPYHYQSFSDFTPIDVKSIIKTWSDIYISLSSEPHINYIQLFENKGSIMGCSNPHPHCQVWALNKLVGEPYKEMVSFEMFSEQNNQKCLLCEYTRVELLNEKHDAKNRVFYKNASFVAIVPFWAVWPFELLIVSRKHLASIAEITSPTIAPESHGGPTVLDDFSDILLVVNRTYDKLFSCTFPFSMGIHQSPTLNDPKMDLFHFHMHFYPPLLRGKNVKKFLVGFELLAEPQRDITVESAAKTLRSLL